MDAKKIGAGILTLIVAPVVVYYLTTGREEHSSHQGQNDPPSETHPLPPPPPKPLPMGPLEHGVNYAHSDLDANKWLDMASAEACSDMCYMRPECKAMTYVVSNRSCWLKYAAENREENPDFISAVRRSP